MREFNSFERALIIDLINTKVSQRLIRSFIVKNMSAIGVYFSQSPKQIKVSVKGRPLELQQEDFDNFLDIIFTIKYLEKNNYLAIYTENLNDIARLEDLSNFKIIIYNQEKYTNIGGVFFMDRERVPTIDWIVTATIVDEVERYLNSYFHVSQELRDLVKNDFKTSEQMRFETEIREMNKQLVAANLQVDRARTTLNVSYLALIVSLILGFLTIYDRLCPNDISRREIKAVIEQKVIPSQIDVNVINDTLITKPLILKREDKTSGGKSRDYK